MNIGSWTCGQKESLIHLLFVISRFHFSIAMVYFTVLQVSRLQRTGSPWVHRPCVITPSGHWQIRRRKGLEVVYSSSATVLMEEIR